MNKKITFFLMGQKGFEVLKSFINEFGINYIAEVITSDDETVSKSYYHEIISFCRSKKINCYDRKTEYTITGNFSFAISWKWIIENYSNLIIFHDSILPQYRGFSPLVNALINGEKKVGVTAIQASSVYDEGKIIEQNILEINYPVKIQTVIENIIPLYCNLVKSIFQKILTGKKIIARKQDEKKATYSPWRDEKDYFIDWEQSSQYIKRFIDSVGEPYKGACTFMNNELVRIFDAEIYPSKKIVISAVGKVIFLKNGNPVVICGKGLLLIKKMVFDKNGKDALPLTKFRSRFSSG